MKLPLPPSSVTGPIGDYLHILWQTLANVPNISYFSGTSPNSALTGVAGDLAVNVGSASTSSRLWVKGGSVTAPDKVNWSVVRIA